MFVRAGVYRVVKDTMGGRLAEPAVSVVLESELEGHNRAQAMDRAGQKASNASP